MQPPPLPPFVSHPRLSCVDTRHPHITRLSILNLHITPPPVYSQQPSALQTTYDIFYNSSHSYHLRRFNRQLKFNGLHFIRNFHTMWRNKLVKYSAKPSQFRPHIKDQKDLLVEQFLK